MLAEANRKADELKQDAADEAKLKALQQLEAAKTEAKEGEDAFDAETTRQVEALKEAAKQKETQAVELILKELF